MYLWLAEWRTDLSNQTRGSSNALRSNEHLCALPLASPLPPPFCRTAQNLQQSTAIYSGIPANRWLSRQRRQRRQRRVIRQLQPSPRKTSKILAEGESRPSTARIFLPAPFQPMDDALSRSTVPRARHLALLLCIIPRRSLSLENSRPHSSSTRFLLRGDRPPLHQLP